MRLNTLARPVGWFSLALGAAELVAARRIAAAHGAPEAKNLVRGFGVREIASGAAVLAWPNSSLPFLARAAGDVLDMGAAGMATRQGSDRSRKLAIGTLVAVGAFLALDLLLARDAAD
jgi:hypothetical protein